MLVPDTTFIGSANAVIMTGATPIFVEVTAGNFQIDLAGADVVAAYVVGLELQDRLGRAANPVHYAAGWHTTSTLCASQVAQ